MIKSANDMTPTPPPPFRPPAGATPNELAALPHFGGAAWKESLEMGRAAMDRTLERERVIAADRDGPVAEAFARHVLAAQQSQMSTSAFGAGVGGLACAAWCGSKWDGKDYEDLFKKIVAGVALGVVGGAVAGVLYERVSGPLLPRISPVLPPDEELLIACRTTPMEVAPAWRREGWARSWAELAKRYVENEAAVRAALSVKPAVTVSLPGVRASLR